VVWDLPYVLTHVSVVVGVLSLVSHVQVVMTVMGQQARDIYKNQAAIRQQLADAAGGG
jgi:hypothetical protein